MKEQAADVLAEADRVGRLGHGTCAYACPGCPVAFDEDALVVRVIGWRPHLARELAGRPRRAWELFSGVLPGEPEAWGPLKEAGVRRVVTPVFSGRSQAMPATLPDLMAAHDEESGCAGSLAAALTALANASNSGLAVGIVAAEGRHGGTPGAGALRALVRLAWSYRVSFEVAWGLTPPCIAPVRDYNQLHL